MGWTYADLKAADAALGNPDFAASAAALNAQTGPIVAVDIPTDEARQVILLTGEWYKIKQLAKMAPSGQNPPTAQDQAIAVADICVDTLTLTKTIHSSNDEKWFTIQEMIAGLVQAGVLSQASADQWAAMRVTTPPKWIPSVTAGDVQTARAQP